MKLLFDQNLSFKLCNIIEHRFPGSSHVRPNGLAEATDQAIWEFARDQGYTIVSQDADFAEMAALTGGPPKVIWLRGGNLSTTQVAALLQHHYQTISSLASDETVCLEIY